MLEPPLGNQSKNGALYAPLRHVPLLLHHLRPAKFRPTAKLPVESGAQNGGYRGEKRPPAAVKSVAGPLACGAISGMGIGQAPVRRSASPLGGDRSSRSVRPASSV